MSNNCSNNGREISIKDICYVSVPTKYFGEIVYEKTPYGIFNTWLSDLRHLKSWKQGAIIEWFLQPDTENVVKFQLSVGLNSYRMERDLSHSPVRTHDGTASWPRKVPTIFQCLIIHNTLAHRWNSHRRNLGFTFLPKDEEPDGPGIKPPAVQENINQVVGCLN